MLLAKPYPSTCCLGQPPSEWGREKHSPWEKVAGLLCGSPQPSVLAWHQHKLSVAREATARQKQTTK